MKSLLADIRIGMVYPIPKRMILSLKLVKAGSFPIQRDHSSQWSPRYQFTDESPHCNGKGTLSVSKKRRKTNRRHWMATLQNPSLIHLHSLPTITSNNMNSPTQLPSRLPTPFYQNLQSTTLPTSNHNRNKDPIKRIPISRCSNTSSHPRTNS